MISRSAAFADRQRIALIQNFHTIRARSSSRHCFAIPRHLPSVTRKELGQKFIQRPISSLISSSSFSNSLFKLKSSGLFRSFSTTRRLFSSGRAEKKAIDKPLKIGIFGISKAYILYLTANFVSNCLIHPFQILDYGALNPYIDQYITHDGRSVNNQWFGTRLEHLFVIPATLTFFDVISQKFWHRTLPRLGLGVRVLSLGATPALWMVNLYVYTWLAVGSFFLQHALFNPDFIGKKNEGKRTEYLKSLLWPLTIAMGLQWQCGPAAEFLARATGGMGGPVGFTCAVLASTTAFVGAKALGFQDFGEYGLSSHELQMNNMQRQGT